MALRTLTATLSEIVGQYCLHLNSIYQPLAQISRGIIADNILYSIILTYAFDMAPMKSCFSINPKEINGLGLNLLFICMWVQFINILTNFFLPIQNSPLYLEPHPSPWLERLAFLSRRGGWVVLLVTPASCWVSLRPLKCGPSKGL